MADKILVDIWIDTAHRPTSWKQYHTVNFLTNDQTRIMYEGASTSNHNHNHKGDQRKAAFYYSSQLQTWFSTRFAAG